MVTKKKNFNEQLEEELLFEDALLYKRGDYWHVRFWLTVDKKYARFSLKTKNKSTAIDKAKKHYFAIKVLETQNKKYYSVTTTDGVAMYLEKRWEDYKRGVIVEGRYKTINTHLKHWLEFIGKDLKLKELERTDCEDYFFKRTKGHQKESLNAAHTTALNEQSTINAMMRWLFKRGETYIDGFDFARVKAQDKGDYANRRGIFTVAEIDAITDVLTAKVKELRAKINEGTNATTLIAICFIGLLMITGMRRGELLKLKWNRVRFVNEVKEVRSKKGARDDLFTITVDGKTSKVNRTRAFVIRDARFIDALGFYCKRFSNERLKFAEKLDARLDGDELFDTLGERLVCSLDGETAFRVQTLHTVFYKVLAEAKVNNVIERKIVPYSLRHYFITRCVNAGLTPVQVAEICGTSATQIEKTYYHTTREKMISNALVDYDVVNNIIVKK
jgi:integrase